MPRSSAPHLLTFDALPVALSADLNRAEQQLLLLIQEGGGCGALKEVDGGNF